ncbi:uncharacterized protein MYCGRDRAFT_92754 [Zymoseptoria tritici IPO323]|uniref:Methyltransferase domain-containing protein n=1 Tax=Zymoseptoria tritici (strain CBS 115943 / IPO323) TaxID=336722 RepID=F9XA27_ZYMTI|nr:uncharacterized protein MYCGRDRAFT_92754 [Zymoseptoria tritici IPO323]EGP88280.1 hypothetical protein MYCGRDRAFT_92754 [Zymoseptoria tritici IPO323]
MSAFTEANRKAFDDLSSTYNSQPWQKAISSQIGNALLAQKEWMGVPWILPTDEPGRRDIRLLDYACGTGSITQVLGPHVSTIRGIDISENMVTKYNEAASSSGLTHEQAHAVVGDLFTQTVAPDLCTSEWYNFDIAVIGLGFHHFEHPDLAIKRLAERLKSETDPPVASASKSTDAPASSSTEPPQPAKDVQHTVKTHGFTPSQIRDFYTAAGFTPESFDITALRESATLHLSSGPSERKIFIAKATKSPTAWQKLTNWLAGGQDTVREQFRTDRVDAQAWRPWAETGPDREVWGVGKNKEEPWGGFEQRAEKKSWNGF